MLANKSPSLVPAITFKVLVVEDDSDQVELLEELLSISDTSRTFNLTRVQTWQQARDSLREIQFDVILLDLSLPDSSALNTIAALQEYSLRSPVVVWTAYNEQELAIKAIQAGAQDFLTKGEVGGNLLARRLSLAIERHKRQQNHDQLKPQNQNPITAVQDLITEVIFQVDGTGKLQFLNEAWTQVTGWTVLESLGQSLQSYIRLDKSSPLQNTIVALSQSSVHYGYLKTKTGKNCRIQLKTKATENSNREIISICGVLQIVFSPNTKTATKTLDYQQIFNAIAVPIFVKNQHNQLVAVNNTFCHWLCCSREALLNPKSSFSPAQTHILEHLDFEGIQTYPCDRYVTLNYLNQQKCHLVIQQNVLTTATGETLFVGKIRDITIYNKQQQAIVDLTARFNRLADNIPGLIYQFRLTANNEKSFSYVSSGCRELYGIEPEVALEDADTLFTVVHPEDSLHLTQTIANSGRTLTPWQTQWRITTPDQNCKWLRGIARPELQENGDILWDGVVIDITELKEFEANLQRQKHLFEKLAETLPNIVYVYDLQQQRSIYSNSKIGEILGYTAEEVAKMGDRLLQNLIHPEDYPRFLQYHQQFQAASDSEIYTIEYRIRNAENQWSWLISRDKVFARNAQGDAIQILGVATDITERKHTELALQISQERLQLALEGSSLGLWDWNLKTGEIYYDRQWKAMLGYAEDEIEGNIVAFEALVHPDDRERVQTILTDYLESRTDTYAVELRMQTKTGQWRWIATHGTVFERDAQGCPLRMTGTHKDITTRKQADSALNLFKQAADSATDAIAIADPQGRHFYQNQAFSELYGYASATEFQESGGPQQVFVDPQVGQEVMQTISRGQSWVGEVVQQSKSGKHLEILLSATAIKDNKGEIVGLVAFNTDIRDRKAAERREKEKAAQLTKVLRQLRSTQAQIIQSEKLASIGQMVAGVAHEINNPVSFIYGNISPALEYAQEILDLLDLYQKSTPNPDPEVLDVLDELDLEFIRKDFPRLLKSMQTGANRIREIVLSLRTFSRVDESEKKEANLQQGIESTIMILQNRLKAHKTCRDIAVMTEFASLPDIECYPGQLNQVFMNLIGNAIDALEEKCETYPDFLPEIQIKTERIATQNAIAIRIIDNGLGIPEAIKKQLFDPFFTTKAVGQGTGLGLSISHQIITEKHQGKLLCFSTPGEGTEFRVELPLP